MSSVYPGAFDNLPATSRVQPISSTNENNQSDAINAIEATLGLNPQAAFATVAQAIASLLAPVPLAPGSILMFAGTTMPSGYLPCDGSTRPQSSYPALYSAIGTNFGPATGGNFTLPDMRSRTPVNVSGTSYPLGNSGGAETVVVSTAQIPSHTHAYANSWLVYGTTSMTSGTTFDIAFDTGPTTTAGSSNAHNNVQPSMPLNFYIKT